MGRKVRTPALETKSPQPGDLVVCETRTSTWHYHLRVLGPEGFKPSGCIDTQALCGKEIGWDTRIPMTSWGSPLSTIGSWCRECAEKAHALNFLVPGQ